MEYLVGFADAIAAEDPHRGLMRYLGGNKSDNFYPIVRKVAVELGLFARAFDLDMISLQRLVDVLVPPSLTLARAPLTSSVPVRYRNTMLDIVRQVWEKSVEHILNGVQVEDAHDPNVLRRAPLLRPAKQRQAAAAPFKTISILVIYSCSCVCV